jgi:RNA polymerase sigma-70 factor, ECF subfamily
MALPRLSKTPMMAPLSEQSAEELAVRAGSGTGQALSCFGELVSRYHTRLYNFLLRRTRCASDAEELTQEAFTRAWERITSYDPSWKFSTWLYTIASRLAVSKHRKMKRERVGGWSNGSDDRGTDLGALAGMRGEAPNDALELEDDRRLGGRLWALAKDSLSEEQQTALWLRYAEDLSIGEIARVMGKTQVGIRVSLFRARQALAGLASEQGWLPGSSRAAQRDVAPGLNEGLNASIAYARRPARSGVSTGGGDRA